MKAQALNQFFKFITAAGVAAGVFNGQAAMPISPGLSPVTASVSGAGYSHSPVFSADGRWLAFVSQANNLVTNDDLGQGLDVFVRDLLANQTILVSLNTNALGGGNLDSGAPSLSADGNWVAFESAADNLVANDTNRASDVFVRDLAQGITRLASVDVTGGFSAAGNSVAPLISADGRWVVFESTATNLVNASFTTNWVQVYARDLQNGVTHLVSVNQASAGPGAGIAESPSISADARWVAFASTATNLTAGVTNRLGEIYLRDLATGTTWWSSSNAAPYFSESTNGYRCLNPVLSRNGEKLAYKALIPRTKVVLVFLHDLHNGSTTCVASNSLDTTWPELSADGRFLACEEATNVMVWDAALQTSRLVSVNQDGQMPANGHSKAPVLSADGRLAVFLSSATDLIVTNPPDTNQIFQVYACSLESNRTWLVSATPAGEPSCDSLEFLLPAISPDNRVVAFESEDSRLVANDRNHATDVFLRNLSDNTTALVSSVQQFRIARTGTGLCHAHPLGLSADGRSVLISSSDNTVVPDDDDLQQDLYWLDLSSRRGARLPVATNAVLPYASLANPVLSDNGQRAAFLRRDPRTWGFHGYVFDSQENATSLFNLDAGGAAAASAFPAIGYDWSMSLSSDGRFLAFAAAGNDLAPGMDSAGFKQILLRDLVAGTNLLLTHSVSNPLRGGYGDSSNPLFSPDGRWLFFYSRALDLVSPAAPYGTRLWTYDFRDQSFRAVARAYTLTGAAFSANSHYVVFSATQYSGDLTFQVYRHDLLATNPVPLSVATNARNPDVSADGQLVVYEASWASGQASDIHLKDLVSGNVELINVSLDGVTTGNGGAFLPQISLDGRFVVFASSASNLAPNDHNDATDIFLRDRALGLTYLLSANPRTGASGNRVSHSPVMSADGGTVIFASWAADLIDGDYNDTQDIFVLRLANGDSDADGLDDAWELAYFGDLSHDGSSDADHDGLTDRHELRAGTDPTNEGSVLRALVLAPVGGPQTTLIWPAAQSRQYQVQFKRSLADPGWSALETTVTASGNTARATDDQGGLDAARFYRILVLP